MPTGFKDTFKLWQVIKNLNDIFDGGTEGKVLTRGATEFDSSWEGPVFGEMTIQGGTTATSIGTADEWTQVVTFNGSHTLGVAYASNLLTIETDGQYHITVAISLTGFAADTFVFGISDSGTVDETSRIERKTASADVGAVALCAVFGLQVDDTVGLYVKNKALTNNPTITEASVVVVKL